MRDAIERALRLLQLGSELDVPKAIEVLKEAIEQAGKQEQEHENRITALEIRVAKLEKPMTDHEKQLMAGQRSLLRTAPPQRQWVGLTDQEISDIWFAHGPRETINGYDFARAIENKFKGKNT